MILTTLFALGICLKIYKLATGNSRGPSLFGSSVESTPDGWQRVTLGDGFASVDMPGPPVKEFESTPEGDQIELNIWVTRADDGLMSLGGRPYKSNFEGEFVAFDSSYAELKQDLAREISATVVRDGTVSVPGARKARETEFRVRGGGTTMIVRYMEYSTGTGGHIVWLMAGGPGISEADRDRFLASYSRSVVADPGGIVPPPSITPPTTTTMPTPVTTPTPATRPTLPTRPTGTMPAPRPAPPPPPPPPPTPMPSPAATIDPFLCAAELPDRNELLTFATRVEGNKPAGLARRYRLPDFTLEATYHLPAAVTRAVADEATGRVIVAGVPRPDPVAAAAPPTERAVAYGGVQIYDLNDLTADAGDAATPAVVRPTEVVEFTPYTRIVGLEVAPDGKACYAVLVYRSGTGPARAWRSRVERIDPATGKVTGRLALPGTVWQSAMAPAGGHLLLADRIVDANGYAVLAGRTGLGVGLTIVDLEKFEVTDSPARLPGPVIDLVPAGDDRLLAAVYDTAGVRLFTADESGATTDATPADWTAARVGTVAWADGRLVASVRGGAGVSVYTAPDLSAPRRFEVRGVASAYDNRPIGGRFVLTRNGTFAVFQGGQVLDVTTTVPGEGPSVRPAFPGGFGPPPGS